MLFSARCLLRCCLCKGNANQYSACSQLLKAPSLNIKHIVPLKPLTCQQCFEASQHIQHRKQNTPALILPHMHMLVVTVARQRAMVAAQNNVTNRDGFKTTGNSA